MGASLADTDVDDDSDFAESHEINVTPFIDVILVLLIIFMVAAPLSTVDLPIDLPTSTATPQKKPDKPTYVSIKPDLSAGDRGKHGQARRPGAPRSTRCPTCSKERYIFLRADRAVPYGELMDVLEILRAGGYSKLKLVALEGVPDAAAQRRRQSLDRPRRAKAIPAALDFCRGDRRLRFIVGGAALAIAHLQIEDVRRCAWAHRRSRSASNWRRCAAR